METCQGASPYTTIQSAVDAVNDDGFTIYVCPGTYNESVSVQNKEALTIRNYVVKNQPAPLIDANNGDGFYIVNSEEVTIRGLRITNATDAINVVNSPETEVRNTIITASLVGILFDQGSHKSEAQQNTISDSSALYGIGLGVGFSTNVTVKQNTISSFPNGIYVMAADKLNLSRAALKVARYSAERVAPVPPRHAYRGARTPAFQICPLYHPSSVCDC